MTEATRLRLLLDMEDRESPSLWPAVFLAGIVAGLVMAAVGWSWKSMTTPASVWPAEKAAELNAAKAAVHRARGGSVGPSGDANATSTSQLAAADARVQALEAELNHARSVRNDWGRRVAACGLGLTILCGLGYLASRGG